MVRDVRLPRPGELRPRRGGTASAALAPWLASRLAVMLVSLGAARLVTSSPVDQVPGFTTLWDHWDVGLFTKVAHYGYHSRAYSDQTDVDFPGLPLAMRLVHLVVPSWVLAGIVVSLLAGTAASLVLGRLATDDAVQLGRDPATGARRAVLAMVAFPYAVFLFAGYSEGLFLACAAGCLLAARRRRWWLAGLLAAGATGTRIIGLAVVAALWVEWLVTLRAAGRPRGPRLLRDLPALLLPLLPPVAFAAYLKGVTGHWDSYSRAMRAGWGRQVAWPWEGLATTVRAAGDTTTASPFHWFWVAEIAAVVGGLALVAVLAYERRWAETSYVGVSTVVMACSSYWASGVRAVLVWFPLYLLLARRPRLLAGYLWMAAPLMVLFVVAFTQGNWVD